MSGSSSPHLSRRRSVGVVIFASTIVVATATLASAAPGAELWAERYDGPKSGADYSMDVAVSPDGSAVFVTGSALGNTSFADMTTIAYDASDGTQRWRKRYNGPANGWDGGRAVEVSPDGSVVFVTGASDGSPSPTDQDYVTVAYSASDGTRLWARRYKGPGEVLDQADGLRIAPDGQTVVVTGQSYGSLDSSFYSKYVTVGYAAGDGTRLWIKVTNGVPEENALALSPDGTRVFMTGAVAGTTSDFDYTTVALDASTGLKVWGQHFNGRANGNDFAVSVGVSPGGSKVYVTGRSEGATTSGDYATIAYRASDGSQRWVRRYDGQANEYDTPAALAVAPDGSRIVVTGQSPGATNDEYATVAYDPSGTQVWAKLYDGAADAPSSAYDLAVTGEPATVVVTGTSAGSTTVLDYATVAYDAATGTRLWASRYDGPDSLEDHAQAIASAPSGSTAFVTGYSFNAATLEDYATVAYSLN
jgi:hypothetical protein